MNIPYFETSRYRVETIVEISGIKKGEKVADLGSGDGRIAIAFAKVGAVAVGFELDEIYIKKSQEYIKKEKLTDKISIYKQDFWDADLSEYDVVAVYPMPDIMEVLQEKLKKELRIGARVLTNYYMFPNWHYEKSKNNIYLYIK